MKMSKERDRFVKTLMASKVPLDIPSDAIVIIEGVRTPVTKANRGTLKDFRADQLLAVVLKVSSLTLSLTKTLLVSACTVRPSCLLQ